MKKFFIVALVAIGAGILFFKIKNKNGSTTAQKTRQATKEEELEISSSTDTRLNGYLDSRFNLPILNNYTTGANVGQRSNNPTNIRPGSNWQGLKGVAIAGKNGKFCVFENNTYGSRAALVLLNNYIKGGYNTISKIINRWAPAADNNNPTNYADFVARNSGVDKDAVLQFEQQENIIKILSAMIQKETAQTLPKETLIKAYDLAK